MKAPEKLYISKYKTNDTEKLYSASVVKYTNDDIEYTRTDAFVEKACEYLYNYNQKQVLKHGARATLGCGEYTINVDEFRKYMKGE